MVCSNLEGIFVNISRKSCIGSKPSNPNYKCNLKFKIHLYLFPSLIVYILSKYIHLIELGVEGQKVASHLFASPGWWISSIQMYIVERIILHVHVIRMILWLWFNGLVNGAMQISVVDTLSQLNHDIDSKVAMVCWDNFNLSPLKFVNMFSFSLLMLFLLIFLIFFISSPLPKVHVFCVPVKLQIFWLHKVHMNFILCLMLDYGTSTCPWLPLTFQFGVNNYYIIGHNRS